MNNNFQQLRLIKDTSDNPTPEKLNANSLSLVQDDELEKDLAFDSMVTKANSQYSAELILIVTRMDTLLASQKLDKLTNPINPKSICKCFHLASNQLELDIKAKLVVFKLFDRLVISKLKTIYQDVNDYFIDEGILPDLTSYSSVHKNASTQKAKNTNSLQEKEVLLTKEVDSGVNFLSELRDLLYQNGSTGEVNNVPYYLTSKNAESNSETLSTVIDNLTLVDALSTIQESSFQRPITKKTYFPVSDLMSKLENTLPFSGPASQHTVGQINDDIINVISMLFDFILDDQNLPDEFKILIGRLQIPVLKVAVIDKTFFSKGSHPARNLLNELARAGIGWTEESESGVFGLRAKVESIVTKIIDEFDDDISLFDKALEDFREFMDIHQNRSLLLEKRLQEAEEGKAKADSARAYAKAELEKIVGNHQLPDVLQKIIFDVWQKVMSLTYLREGYKSEAWNKNASVMIDLMNSLTVPHSFKLIKRLKNNIVDLADDIKTGLVSVGYDEFEIQDLLKNLDGLHKTIISGKKVLITPVADQHSDADTNDGDSAFSNIVDLSDERTHLENDELENDSLDNAFKIDESLLDEIDLSSDEDMNETSNSGNYFDSSMVDSGSLLEDDEVVLLVDKLQTGSWFELKQNEKKVRVKLAAVISVVGKYLFVNNTGKKIADYTRLDLIAEFKRKNIIQLDSGALFDRALKSIVSDFRVQKQQYENSGF
ncbi:MAG: DUF1631 domain-containing protein [Gammaproteobacteria bacterium]|nr:DUF1631 domain-containing protein [Gammaproteobacteria bacterium]